MMNIISVQGLPLVACLIMLAILGYIGMHVLKREIIFIDIALAQIAAVGAIVAQVVFHLHGHSIVAQALALGSTLVAAAFFAVVRRRIVQIPLEAVIGVSYAASAAAALFLVGIAPGGHVHIQEMLAGSILWVTASDVAWSAVVFAAVGACFYLFRTPLREISDSYDTAVKKGYNTLGWDFLFYALVGVVITVAVRIAGVVVVFAFLIIPATLSAVLASGWNGRLLIACAGGALSAVLGLLFADRYDFSVGPAIALFLGAILVVVGLLRLFRVTKAVSAASVIVISLVVAVWFASGVRGSQKSGGARGPRPVHDPGGSATHAHPRDAAWDHVHVAEGELERETITEESLKTVSDVERLEALYAGASDADERSAVACRLLEVDVRAGVSMAVDFLETDPPLLFVVTVVDKIEEVTGQPMPYDIDQPFASPANQRALTELKKTLGEE